MGIDGKFWKERSVFITGHTGFKGGWLSLWLQTMGATVTGYALEPDTDPSFYYAADVENEMTSIIGDIRDGERLMSSMADAEPEVAFHLAAQPLVKKSYDDPVETYAVNVLGTVNFLEAVRKIPSIRSVVVVTSDKCYANQDRIVRLKEDTPMGGDDPYSSSKGCAELVTHAYRKSFFQERDCGLASARAGNVIGGGDWAEHRLIPDIVRAFIDKKPLNLRYPHAVRPWQHVLEPINGYLQLAEHLWSANDAYAKGWNFGPSEKPRTVLEIVRTALNFWDGDIKWGRSVNPEHTESHYLSIDSSMANETMGWDTLLDSETMLDWTFLWYRKFSEQSVDMRTFSQQQIEQFSKAIELSSTATGIAS